MTITERPIRSSTLVPEILLLAGWFGYLLIAPTSGFFWVDAWHNEQRAVQAILLAVTATLAVAVPGWRAALVPSRNMMFALSALLLLGTASALNATHVAAAFVEISLHVMVVVLAVLTAAAVRRAPTWFSVGFRRACLFLAAAHVLGIAARYTGMLVLERPPGLDVLLLGYANPRFPTALYALLIPFLATLATDRDENRLLRGLALPALALLWAVNIGLGTRAIWFAYAIMVPMLLGTFGWRRARRFLQILGGSALAGAIVYYVLFIGVPAWLDLGSAIPSRPDRLTTLSARAELWVQSWNILVTQPLLGVGPMNFAALGDSYAAHPHNWVLQLAAEWGIPALVLALWILWRLGGTLHRTLRVDRGIDLQVLAPYAATVVGLVYALVDGNLVMPVSQTAFALILGALLGCTVPAASDMSRDHGLVAAMNGAIAVACASWLTIYVLGTLPDQVRIEKVWRASSKYPELAPRFWQQGLLR